MGSHERKASPGFTDYIRFQHVRSTPVLRLIQQKLLINNSIKMRYSFALLAGVAAASYIPEAPSSSAKGYGYGDYAPKPSSSSAAPSSSAKGYGGDYWPKSSSSSSVKAPYVPKSSSAPYKPTYTTIECEGPTTFTYGSKTYSAETKTSWVVECTDEPYVPKPEPVKSSSYEVKPTYEPKPVYPTKPAYTPSASVTKTGPLQVTANAAVNNVAGAGAALAGVFGAVAYLL